MAIYYLGCDAYLTHQIQNSPDFYRHEVAEIELSIGATNLQIDRLIIGPTIQNLTQFTATISDWNLPPVALLILPEKNFDGVVDSLNHHPRVGRSIFICKDIAESVSQSVTDWRQYSPFTSKGIRCNSIIQSQAATRSTISHRTGYFRR
ncbi:MAG: hypothetical protein ACI8Z5_000386 [Lentimonas sp.]|jgi:hypothetical protein